MFSDFLKKRNQDMEITGELDLNVNSINIADNLRVKDTYILNDARDLFNLSSINTGNLTIDSSLIATQINDTAITLYTPGNSGYVNILSRGLLLPRVTTVQRNNIVPPISGAGLQVYDTDLNEICIYNGTDWFYKSYMFLALNNELHVTSSGLILSDYTVTSYPATQDNIYISSGNINLKPGLYRCHGMASFLNKDSGNTERSCAFIFRRGTEELFRNASGVGYFDSNNTTCSVNLQFLLESTSYSDNYTFRATSDSNGSAFISQLTRIYIERIR